jgi:hypothetical protein
MRLMRYPGDVTWWIVGFVIYAFWIAITIYLIRNRFGSEGTTVFKLFLFSTPVTCSLTMIGHIDVWSLLGASLAVLGRFRGAVFLGSVIAASGNIELNLATSFLILIFAVCDIGISRRVAKAWVPIGIISYIGMHQIVKVNSSVNVGAIVFHGMKAVFHTAAGCLPLYAYSLYGILWLPLVLVISTKISLSKKIALTCGLFIFPFLMSILILDGTRVGTTASYACFLLFMTDSVLRSHTIKLFTEVTTGLLFLAFVALPTIIVDDGGILRLPFQKILKFKSGI